MKSQLHPPRSGTKPLASLLSLAAGTLLPVSVLAIPAPINLGTAGNFGVLSGAGITMTGPTTIPGASTSVALLALGSGLAGYR